MASEPFSHTYGMRSATGEKSRRRLVYCLPEAGTKTMPASTMRSTSPSICGEKRGAQFTSMVPSMSLAMSLGVRMGSPCRRRRPALGREVRRLQEKTRRGRWIFIMSYLP